MTEDPFTADELAEYSDDLEDVTKKELLLEIMVELKTIRYYAEQALQPEQEPSESETPDLYECTMCEATVPADKREDHARSEHNAPPGMDVSGEFERVEE